MEVAKLKTTVAGLTQKASTQARELHTRVQQRRNGAKASPAQTKRELPAVRVPEIDYSDSDTPPAPPVVQLIHVKQMMKVQQDPVAGGRVQMALAGSDAAEVDEHMLAMLPMSCEDARGILALTNKRVSFVPLNDATRGGKIAKATTGFAARGASRYGSRAVGNFVSERLESVPVVGTFLGMAARRTSGKAINRGFHRAVASIQGKNGKKRPQIDLARLDDNRNGVETNWSGVTGLSLTRSVGEDEASELVSLAITGNEAQHTFSARNPKAFDKVAAFVRRYLASDAEVTTATDGNNIEINLRK
jgi:hypothetical protein